MVKLTSQCYPQSKGNGAIDTFLDDYFNKPLFDLDSVTAEEVEFVKNSLKNKFSSGVDELPVAVLKDVKNQLCQVWNI